MRRIVRLVVRARLHVGIVHTSILVNEVVLQGTGGRLRAGGSSCRRNEGDLRHRFIPTRSGINSRAASLQTEIVVELLKVRMCI